MLNGASFVYFVSWVAQNKILYELITFLVSKLLTCKQLSDKHSGVKRMSITVGLSRRRKPTSRCSIRRRQWSLWASPFSSICWCSTAPTRSLWCLWSTRAERAVWAWTRGCPRWALRGLRGTASWRALWTRCPCR